MALTQLQVRDICYGGGTKVCKYLDYVNRKDRKYVAVCTKFNPGAYADLEKKRAGWGQSFNNDNCNGYLYLQYKDQGYDVKK